jgi:16S rRNA (adenine1518-N6/adenine1519-N6)-dimethyltransferase
MMQKEVARRIVSEPGTKEYGILSVQLQLMASVSYLFDVPPGVFSPPPKVDSAVIQLRFDRPALQCRDESLKAVVRTVFNKRRKKISNALKDLPPVTHLGSSTPPDGSSHPGLSNQPGPSTHPDLSNQPDLFALLEARGFDLSKRAGDWTPAMYEKLAGTLEQLGIL